MTTVYERRAITLVALMVLASWTPLASLPVASAHSGIIAEWGSEGSNDTGWLRMDATGANAAAGQMAMSNLMLDFAPGAEISNLSFEIRVNGSDGTWIEEPQLLLPDAPASILDWRGLGSLGQQSAPGHRQWSGQGSQSGRGRSHSTILAVALGSQVGSWPAKVALARATARSSQRLWTVEWGLGRPWPEPQHDPGSGSGQLSGARAHVRACARARARMRAGTRAKSGPGQLQLPSGPK